MGKFSAIEQERADLMEAIDNYMTDLSSEDISTAEELPNYHCCEPTV